jgi:hypothetical protein
MFRCVIHLQCNAERSGAEMEERSKELFTMFRCVIHLQCNAERSRAEMVERSREHFTMFSCVIHHQYNGAEQRWKKNPGNFLQCSGALFIFSVTRSGAERSRAEMEERSREHFTMFRSVFHLQCNAERSEDGRKIHGNFYNVQEHYSSSV